MTAGIIILGKKIFNLTYQIVVINFDKDETDKVPFDYYIVSLANSTAVLIGTHYKFSEIDLVINSDYVEYSYGMIGVLENEAITVTTKTESILIGDALKLAEIDDTNLFLKQGKPLISNFEHSIWWIDRLLLGEIAAK